MQRTVTKRANFSDANGLCSCQYSPCALSLRHATVTYYTPTTAMKIEHYVINSIPTKRYTIYRAPIPTNLEVVVQFRHGRAFAP